LLATSNLTVGPDIRDLIVRTAPAGALEKMDQALANDAVDAKANSDRIARELTAEQIDEAHKLASAWKPGKLIDDSAR
jgi:hypothetical protein